MVVREVARPENRKETASQEVKKFAPSIEILHELCADPKRQFTFDDTISDGSRVKLENRKTYTDFCISLLSKQDGDSTEYHIILGVSKDFNSHLKSKLKPSRIKTEKVAEKIFKHIHEVYKNKEDVKAAIMQLDRLTETKDSE